MADGDATQVRNERRAEPVHGRGVACDTPCVCGDPATQLASAPSKHTVHAVLIYNDACMWQRA